MTDNVAFRHGRANSVPESKPAVDWSGELEVLAGRLARLCPVPRRPMAFHEEKSELTATLRKLARAKADGDV